MAEPEQDQELDLEIGDTLHILGGQFDKTQGVLYGYTAERFTLMPTGVSDRVIHIPLVDGAPDPDLDLEEILVLRKAAKPGFVHLLDLRGGQYVETFASGGIPSTRYTVKEVNEARDSAVLADEAGDEEEIVFGFRGIPRDLPFEVMRTRDAPLPAALPAAPAEAPVSPLVVDDQDLGDAIPDDALVQGAEPAAAAPVTYELGDTVDIQLDEEIKEISTANRFYPDVFQRSEMLSQLIRLLPESQQRNPVKLQGVRRMVERMMHLRNQAVEYGLAGEPRGERATSASTLSDLLSHGTPTLGRAVVNMKKVFYMSHANPPEADPEDAYVDNENLVGVYLSDVIKSDGTMQEEYASKGEGLPSSVAGSVPTFYTHMENLRKLNSPYSMTMGAMKSVPADKEVFRLEPPGGEGVPSYQIMDQNPETTAPYSLVRTLKERTAGGAREPRQVETAETPELVSTLLFPRSTQVELGPIRSGFLGLDISRSITPRFLLSEWIDTLGDATDFPTADGLLLLGLNGIVGNVGVKEWLEAQSFPLNSVAEAHTLFSAYGFSQLEWNTEQAAVLQNKVDATLAGIRVFLARTREEAAAGVKETVAAGLLTEARSADLLARVESEPLLQKAIETLRRGLGSAANVDIIWFSALAVTAPDLLLAVLGQQPAPLVRERLRLILKQRTVANENGYKLRLKLASAGEPPFENPCEHTAALEKVRRVSGADGTKLLAKFLGHYRSRTEDNWVFCNVCDSHLLCGHELLLIQQFVRPKEREALYKEMLLTFSAGTEGRSYICRECGQSLKEIEYDTNLEFDDEGRPMMGRSVMVDKDAIAEQEIEDLLADPATTKQDSADQEEEQYTSDENKRIHRVLKRIAGLLGVAPDAADYKRIMEEVTGYIVTLLTRDAYIAETRGKKAPDYDIYRSLRIVSAAAAAMLLDIQTHIPEYKVYFTSADCVGGFGGWPLVITDAPLAGAGITCVSTVVAGINDDEEPWNQTTLQRQPNLLKRREALEKYVKGQVDMFLKSPAVQAALVRKREYLEEIGKSATGTKTRDQLRSTFRPVPHKVSTKDAAKEPIAAGAATPRKAAEAWIRSAHGLAAAAGAAVKGCCFKSLSAPAEAWAGLPALAERVEARRSDVRAVTTFEAGIAKPLDAKTDPAAYWRLFSRLCWRGESKGRPHQLGIGLTCGECGLNFIENPSLTAAAEVIGQEQAAKLSTQLIQHMETQGVVIDEDTFLDLLDTAHRVQKTVASVVPPPPRFEFPTGVGPLDGWPILLTEVQTALSELGSTATTLQVATAAEKLVRAIAEKELFIRERIGAEAFARLETLTTKTARECGNAVMTGFVVPFQRWLTSVNQSSFKVLDSYELSPETVADILVKGMGVHLRPLGETSSLTGLARAKAAGFVAEVSEYCRSIFPVLRASLTPGGSVMVVYLLRAYVMGSVARLLDPHDVPGGAAAAAEAAEGEEEGVGLRGLQRAFLTCLTRYSTGSRIPTEDEIRLDLEKRSEAEKQKFIKRLDGMTREQRRVDLAEKAIGIGVWAIGGSKKLRTYDADRYEEERNERALAGLTDYPEADAAAASAALDSGYDNEQQKEDDY